MYISGKCDPLVGYSLYRPKSDIDFKM